MSQNINHSMTSTFNIHPNPASDFTIVEYSFTDPDINGVISIIDISGKVYWTKSITIPHDQVTIDLTGMIPGNYLITIKTDNLPINSKSLTISR